MENIATFESYVSVESHRESSCSLFSHVVRYQKANHLMPRLLSGFREEHLDSSQTYATPLILVMSVLVLYARVASLAFFCQTDFFQLHLAGKLLQLLSLPQDTSGTLYQLQINLVSGCCALLAMEICRCCGSALQLDLIVPSHLLDHLHGTVPMHLRSVGLDLVQRTILKCLRTACFSPSDSFQCISAEVL